MSPTLVCLMLLGAPSGPAPDDARPAVFRITPLRPVAELRKEALAARPPAEPGPFKPVDLVELSQLDATIRLGITTARDAGGADLGVKQAIEDGIVRGPRLLTASQGGSRLEVRRFPLRRAYTPALFATVYYPTHGDSLFRAEQVDGFLTLLPRQYVFPGLKITSPPVVLGKSNKVALGGQHFVYLVSLDEKGMPLLDVLETQVLNPSVHALAYSEKLDRLYVGVEVSK